jgi:hypothetical protein
LAGRGGVVKEGPAKAANPSGSISFAYYKICNSGTVAAVIPDYHNGGIGFFGQSGRKKQFYPVMFQRLPAE